MTVPPSDLVDDRVVTDGFLDALRAYPEIVAQGALIGDGDAPATATEPLFIQVRQLPDGVHADGPAFGAKGSVRGLKFQLHCVGRTRQVAQGLAAATLRFLFERAVDFDNSAGDYLNPIPVDKHVIFDRELVSNVGSVDSGRVQGHVLHIRFHTQRTER